MKHTDIINGALDVLKPRGAAYGDVRENHDHIASLASTLTRKELSARDIALVLLAVKLGRMTTSPELADHYVDAVNYLAFAGEFAMSSSGAKSDKPAKAGGTDDFE
jgi:hypothetical protein